MGGKKTKWSQFLRSHWPTLAASDFFTTKVWTTKGLVTINTLFVIKIATRRVQVAGSTAHSNGSKIDLAILTLKDL